MSSTPPPGTGYFIAPLSGPGPGVLFLHSAWGLNKAARNQCNRLADLGYTVLAPDFLDGEVSETDDEAWDALASLDTNVAASLIQSSARILQRATAYPDRPMGLVGYSAGTSWGLWLGARMADMFSAVVGFYGTQSIDMADASADVLCHFAADDTVVSDFEVADLGLRFKQAGLDFRFEHHRGVGHGFAEEGNPSFDARAEAVAWRQTTEFLAERLNPTAPNHVDPPIV